jgi:hypothetical protein
MKGIYSLSTILFFLLEVSFAQTLPIFDSQNSLTLRATGSIKSIKKKSNDSTFVTGKFEYKQDNGNWLTVPVSTRVRGNFRLRYCYFPPLKLKFNKKEVASTLFAGNKALKLVLPCRTSSDMNNLIRREYLCYQIYQIVSPVYFRTRLAKLDLTETSKKKAKKFDLLTFFVEDNSLVAKRHDGKVVETKGISPAMFDEKQSIRNDFFQYMIGNTDWSAVFQHNSNTMYVKGKYIPLSYDFDMSGFVNAGYAQQNAPTLGTGDVRERIYRGFCKSKPAMEEIRKEFLDKESAIHAAIDFESPGFNKSELKDMHSYINGFFEILKDDKLFKESILDQCRTK